MVSGLPILMLVAAQAAAEPTAPPPPEEKAESSNNLESCKTPYPKEGEDEVVICVERPQGYRLDPDLREAEKQARKNKLKRPERYVDNSCATVGPMGCRGDPGINLMAVALTAAEMARRAANGENVGELFITDPQPDEFKLYQQIKREREAKKAAEAQALKEKVAEAEATRAE